MLKPALYGHPDWGRKKTDYYYNLWAEGENTSYVSGDYYDLFKSSDAMIHDCGSFLIEYLYVNKPVMFLDNHNRQSQSNYVGKKAYNCHYIGKCKADIRRFLEMIIDNDDRMTNNRQSFFDDILQPPHGKTVAGNIIENLKMELFRI